MQAELLQRDQVHIWTIERDRTADLALLPRWLSPEERQRADRLKVAHHREAFVYNRAMLRRVLASYAGVGPQQVPLTITASGKPVWSAASPPLTFNLTHHQDLAIVAVSAERAIGIDLESRDSRTDYTALARQALSAREMQQYEQLAGNERPAAILRAWTRKEAFLKAVGIGLGRPLAEIEVTFLRTEHPQILATGDPREPASAWLLECWSPRPGWFAALATPRQSGALHLRFYHAASLRDWPAEMHDETRVRAAPCPERENQHVA
jgi:4'-phosphopantetheinyl transferase